MFPYLTLDILGLLEVEPVVPPPLSAAGGLRFLECFLLSDEVDKLSLNELSLCKTGLPPSAIIDKFLDSFVLKCAIIGILASRG